MRLGALLGPITDPSDPSALAEQARMLADLGYDSLWSAHAVGRRFMFSDPFVALATAAAVTTDVELGTAVLQLPLYAPGELAHRIISLHQVCGDRLLLGVGAGSTADDFAAAGRTYDRRFDTFTSTLTQLRSLLSTGAGDGFDLAPWPTTAGGPPLLFGTWGKGVERAAAEFDGWIASGAYRTPEQVAAAATRYRAAGGGRAIVSTIRLGPDVDVAGADRLLTSFADAGMDDAVVMFLPGGPSPDDIRKLVT